MTIHVVEDGPADGPVVLLLHGFASSSHSWSLVVPLLADTFRVVRVDLLGHGATGVPPPMHPRRPWRSPTSCNASTSPT